MYGKLTLILLQTKAYGPDLLVLVKIVFLNYRIFTPPVTSYIISSLNEGNGIDDIGFSGESLKRIKVCTPAVAYDEEPPPPRSVLTSASPENVRASYPTRP